MNRRLLIQVTAPAVFVGFLLCGACLVSAWHVNRLQANLADVLAQNVSSLQAAQELEASVRGMRHFCVLYLVDPHPPLLDEIGGREREVQRWLTRAEEVASTPEEQVAVAAIREHFLRFRDSMEDLRREVDRRGPRNDVRSLADALSLRDITDLCGEYAALNHRFIGQTARTGERVSRRLNLTMLLLAFGGPLGGLMSGYGIARGLGRSLVRLSVQVRDLAQRLEQDVAAVDLNPDGDLQRLDHHLRCVVRRVSEVVERNHAQQREILRVQQLAAVGQLAASVAHEVRNPLTAIQMLVEAALRPRRPKPLGESELRVIHGEILRLEGTVRGFLDFARPAALERRVVKLQSVVSNAVELVRARARQQGVALATQGLETPVQVNLDAGQFHTVLVNLLLNALDAMPGGGQLQVAVEENGDEVVLCVLDTGPGIAPEVRERLFTPFVSTKPTGSGLGLSICKRVVEDHAGRLVAEDRPVGGACFTIHLPALAKE